MKSFIHNKTKVIVTPLIIFFIFSFFALAQSADDCLMCHGEPGMTMEKNGKTINITVDPAIFKSSAHGKKACVECHKGFNPDDIPHKAHITPVNCKSCHSAPLEKHPFHPQLAMADGIGGSPDLNCKGCHGHHDVMTKSSPTSPINFMNSTEYCGKCHTKEKILHMKSDHYIQLNKNNPKAPTCIFCHSHPVTKNFKLTAVQLKKNQEDLCLSCHLDDAQTKTEYSTSLINYRNSVHGKAIERGISAAAVCTDCHGAHIFEKASSPTSNVRKSNVANVCSKCHIGVAQEYKRSVHGIALEKGNPDVPTCSYCHGEHSINPVVEVPLKMFTDNQINPEAAVKTKMVYCVKCHADEKMMKKYGILTFNKAHDWLPSLGKHNKTVRCVDCHSSYTPPNLSHNLLPPEKTIKKCEECHSKNSVLMSKLYKHEKSQSRKKYGFINGTLLSDAYVVGTTRNVFLDSFSVIAFVVILIGIGFHAFMRWYFKKGH